MRLIQFYANQAMTEISKTEFSVCGLKPNPPFGPKELPI